MFYKKKLTKKQWILYPFLLLFLTLFILLVYTQTNDRFLFRQFSEELFSSELSSNSLSLHYTLAYPEKYGFTDEITLPVYTGLSDPGKEKEELLSTLSKLSRISRNNLDDRDAYAYDLLMRYLNLKLKGTEFSYYSEPFSPNSGIQSGFPILLADYTFRRKQDVENYLDILEQSDAYLTGLLQYETEKANAGLFMSDSSAAKVIRQCDTIMDEDDLKEGTHFLHTNFKERIVALVEAGEISQEEAENYLSENDRLLTTVVRPAYEKIGDTFTLLMGKGSNENGLCYFPKGREYYEYLLAETTGSNRSVAEIKRLLFADFKENYNALITLLSEYPEIADANLTASFDLSPSSPEEILSDLQKHLSKDFPAFPIESGDFSPGVTIKSVSSSMEDYTSPAYYLTPPIDDMSTNIIYINQKSISSNLSLYTTLAHEGYPGHLYQTVYSQLYSTQEGDSLIRHLLHYGGYVEGWAYYVEDLSYQYAKDLVKTNAYAGAYYEACRLNRNLHLCLYSLLDISIHYDGASLNQVAQILQSIGITNQNTTSSIYQYIVEEPANYPKYYLGFLEIKMLKEQAMNFWGNEFSLYRFHQFLLENGPSDFISLREQLQASSSSIMLSK